MPDKQSTIAVTITADHKRLRQDLRRASGEVKAFERNVQGTMNRIKSMRQRIMSTGIMGKGGGALRTAAGFAGVFGFQQLITEARDVDARLTDIGITGNLTRRQLQGLKNEMFAVSKATALGTNSVLDFVDAVTVQTGNTQAARDALADIGEVAVATGADMGALGGVFVKLTTSLKLLPSQAKQAFNVLRSQEKLGSVTLANIATNFGKVVGAGGAFGESAQGIRGVQALGGLYQITQRGFSVGQEGESATAAAAFLRFLGQKSKLVKKTFGVDVIDKATGKARDLPTVFEELGVAFNKDPKAFREKASLIFGRAGYRTAAQLKDAASGGSFGQRFGKYEAANKLFGAGGTDVIASDARKRRASDAFKFNKAMNDMRVQLQKMAIDVLPKIAKVMPQFVKALKFILDNSRLLFELWLGFKGAAFFQRLLAPVGGGVMGGGVGAGAAMGGVGAVGAGGLAGRSRALAAGGGRFGPRYQSLYNPAPGYGLVGGFGTSLNSRYTDAQLLDRERRRGGRMKQAGRAIYRGAGGVMSHGLNALPLIPAAFSGGEYAGGVFNKLTGGAFGSIAEANAASMEAAIAKQRGLHNLWLARSKGRRLGSAKMAMQQYFGLESGGARVKRDIKDTLGGIGFAGLGGFNLDLNRVFTGRDPEKGATSILGKLKGQRSAVMARARKEAIALQLDPNKKEDLYKVAPILRTLDGTISKIDTALARLISGKGITLYPIINIPKGPTPADRLPSTRSPGRPKGSGAPAGTFQPHAPQTAGETARLMGST